MRLLVAATISPRPALLQDTALQESLQCFERASFQEVRRNWRMEIELNELPVSPTWPEGIELRPFVPGRDARAVFEVVEGAFQDDWESTPEEFAEWRS